MKCLCPLFGLASLFFRLVDVHRLEKSVRLEMTDASVKAEDLYAGCYYKGYTYVEIDSIFQRQKAKSAELCQAKCSKTAACLHFTWWTDEGCHFHGPSAMRIPTPGMGTVTGPKRCPSCIIKNSKYEPLDMAGGPGRSVAESVSACQSFCQRTPGCERFTWFLNKGCHLADSSSSLVPDSNAKAGPSTCETQALQEKMVKISQQRLVQDCVRKTLSKACCVFDKTLGTSKYQEYGADECQDMSSLMGNRAFARCPMGLSPFVFKKVNSNFEFKARPYTRTKTISGYIWFLLQECDHNSVGNFGCKCALSKEDADDFD